MGSRRLPAVVVLLAVLAGCRTASVPSAARKPNVVVVVVASLRADHLGVAGYGKPTTPHLDALAREGARFAGARATSSWTLPSVTSVLTALSPLAHGADRANTALATDVPTMPEAFREAGYTTAAISADPCWVTPRFGLDRGFEEFVVQHGPVVAAGTSGDVVPADPWFRSLVQPSPADVVTREALEWIARHVDAAAPYFLYVHYFDLHAGHHPPAAEAARFGVAPDDPLRGDAQRLLLASGKAPDDPRVVATLIALYDAEIAHADAAIGALVAGVRETGAPTLFVVLADHGEEFNDHAGLGHGRTLYDEVLRVPFILAGPGVPAGVVVPRAVSLVSVWPTLAELVGVRSPNAPAAPALADLARGKDVTKASNVFAELEDWFPGVVPVHHRAVVAGTWKVLPAIGPAPTLFDLAGDPLEQVGAVARDDQRDFLETTLKSHERRARQERARHPPRIIEE